ncbi:MAG: hypothetical protein RL033_6613, partial [Pseudomonadota bacterium]
STGQVIDLVDQFATRPRLREASFVNSVLPP